MVLNKLFSSQELFRKAKKIASKNKKTLENVEFIESARVPLIKFLCKESGYEFDVCFNEDGGLFAIEEINRSLNLYPEIRYLFLLLKIFLRQRKMHNSYTGGIGSFLLFCMLLHFLRDFKYKIVKNFDNKALQDLTLSHLLMQFFYYYGVSFYASDYEIDICNWPYVKPKRVKNNSFSLISPQDSSQNLGQACFKFYEIFKVFKNRYNYVVNLEHMEGDSILMHLINPSMLSFETYENN